MNNEREFYWKYSEYSFVEMHSLVDERSAVFMVYGIEEESGECVVLSCTDSTASRNYIPGLTEAYYRKLPIIALKSTQPLFIW